MSQWPCPASSCSHSLELGLCAKWVIPVQRDILGVSLNYPPWSTQNSLSRSSPLFKSLIAHIFFWWPLGSHGKEASCNAGDLGSITGLGRSPGERNGNPLQYSCLENPMDRGAWQATVHGVPRIRHNLVTKPPPPRTYSIFHIILDFRLLQDIDYNSLCYTVNLCCLLHIYFFN